MLLKYVFFSLLLLKMQQEQISPVLSAAELLMNKKWVLTSYGFDENRNGRIDMMEDRIEECERDDTFEFHTDGTGIARDNFLSCCNGPDEQTFQWRFANNGNSIVMFGDTVGITKLTTRELIMHKRISNGQGSFPDLITIYQLGN